MNDQVFLTDKTYRVRELLGENGDLSQRELAHRSGFSLGMVNLLLRRLVKTGYVKVAALNRKKMEYLLTSKGLTEKTVRSYQYLLRAARTIDLSHRRIETLLDDLIRRGHRHFILVGEGDVARLVEMAAATRRDVELRRSPGAPVPSAGEVVLDCRFRGEGGFEGISVLEKILGGPLP